MNITYKKIIENEEINAYLDMGNQVLGVIPIIPGNMPSL